MLQAGLCDKEKNYAGKLTILEFTSIVWGLMQTLCQLLVFNCGYCCSRHYSRE